MQRPLTIQDLLAIIGMCQCIVLYALHNHFIYTYSYSLSVIKSLRSGSLLSEGLSLS